MYYGVTVTPSNRYTLKKINFFDGHSGDRSAFKMSQTTQSQLPIYTIQIGSPTGYSNDATIDMSSTINADIRNAPAGYQIVVNIGPGEYGLKSSILVPSNTTVIGNDATLIALQNPVSNWALIENANSGIQYSTGNTGDSNISVQGLTFIINGQHDFGTWFVNAANVDVQNNVYIGGVDGNAFTSVINGVVSNNISFAQDNVSFDNWNGPVNVTIENNSSYAYGADQGVGPSGWNVLFNASTAQIVYQGDAAQYGIAAGSSSNDAIVNNLFSSNWPTSTSTNTDTLLEYGFATSANITQQGNVFSGLGFTDTGSMYSASPMSGTTISDNAFVGLTRDTTNSWGVIESLSQNSSGTLVTSNAVISGNLIFGLLNDGTARPIENEGFLPVTVNNADIMSNTISSSSINNDAFGTTSVIQGNILNSGTVTQGTGVTPNLSILAPAELFLPIGIVGSLGNFSVVDALVGQINVTLTVQFGYLSFSKMPSNVSQYSNLGNSGFKITGDVTSVNAALSLLQYTGSSRGWDDSIEITATDSSGNTTTRYIPITELTATTGSSAITTITPGEIMPESGTTTVPSGFSGANLPSAPNLNGDTVVASAGNNIIIMGSLDSVVFTSSGNDTILGGSNQGYITTGQGNDVIELYQSGSYTVAGGAGSLIVNALVGNNLLEGGASDSTFNLGTGQSSVIGGLGALTVNGGNGNFVFSSLPQDAGNAELNLGSGNSTIFALSGNENIVTKKNTSNIIYLGIGNTTLQSSGNDEINLGVGSATVSATAGGNDTINGLSSGSLNFDGGSGSCVIQLGSNIGSNATLNLGSGLSSVVDGLGTLTINGGSGNLFFSTLSQASGNADLNLGSGNSTILALSGDESITTQQNTSNVIDLGVGLNSVQSAGNDFIDIGSGTVTIDATLGGSDTINGYGKGFLNFIGGSGISFISLASSARITAGLGNLAVQANSNSYTLDLSSELGTSREIAFSDIPGSIILSGFSSNPIVAENLSGGIFSVVLTDGSTIKLMNSSVNSDSILSNMLGFSMIPITNNQTSYNIDNIAGMSSVNGSNSSVIINNIVASITPTQSATLFSTGFENNGIIRL